MKTNSIGGTLLLCAVLGACSSAPKPEAATPAAVAQEAAPPPAKPQPAVAEAAGPCTIDAVYFAHDSSELDAAARDTLDRDARCLKERGAKGAKVVGSTDPTGTEEYNMALGERRASAAVKYLSALGVDDKALKAVSTGEESASSDESSYAKDRRAEMQPL